MNKVIICGTIENLKFSEVNNKEKTNFKINFNDVFFNKKSNKSVERKQTLSCVAWSSISSEIKKYFKENDEVCLVGRLFNIQSENNSIKTIIIVQAIEHFNKERKKELFSEIWADLNSFVDE